MVEWLWVELIIDNVDVCFVFIIYFCLFVCIGLGFIRDLFIYFDVNVFWYK